MESKTSRFIDQVRNSSPGFKQFMRVVVLASGLALVPYVVKANTHASAANATEVANRIPGVRVDDPATCSTAKRGVVHILNGRAVAFNAQLEGVTKDGTIEPEGSFTLQPGQEKTFEMAPVYEDGRAIVIAQDGSGQAKAEIDCVPNEVVPSSSTSSTTTQPATTTSTIKASTTSTSIAAITTSTIAPATTSTSLMGGMTSTTIAGVINNQPPATIDLYALATGLQGAGDQSHVGSAAQNAVSVDLANHRTG